MSLYYLNLKDYLYLKDNLSNTFCKFDVMGGRCYFTYTLSIPMKTLYSSIIIRKFSRLDYPISLILNPNQQQLT